MATTKTAPPPPLADGVYFGLDEERYHADTALGSSNIRDCLKGPNVFWQSSWMNPKRRKPKIGDDARIFGNALHRLLLEGAAPFKNEFVRGPYGGDSELTSTEKSALTKKAKGALKDHQELLKADEYDFITEVREIIDQDPELAGCLDNGPSEVSVFWTRPDGTRLKCRFDKLKLRGYGDLKSIANERGEEIGRACRYAFTKWRYDIQLEHYNEGRIELRDLVRAKKIFFAEEHILKIKPVTPAMLAAVEFLNAVADQAQFAAQIVFIPKPGTDAKNPPDAWSEVYSPGNPIFGPARDDIETALMIHRDAMKKYGVDKRWLPGRKIGEAAVEEYPYELSRRVPQS